MPKKIKEVLDDLKLGLQKSYKQRLKGLFLFGSYARGEANPESDLDIALIVDDFNSTSDIIHNTSELVSNISLNYNLVISLHPIREKDWSIRRTPLILNLKREGVPF